MSNLDLDSEPHPIKVHVEGGQAVLLNAPKRTRITFDEMAAYPHFFVREGPTISVNASNGCLVYAIRSVNNARGWFELDKLMEMEVE